MTQLHVITNQEKRKRINSMNFNCMNWNKPWFNRRASIYRLNIRGCIQFIHWIHWIEMIMEISLSTWEKVVFIIQILEYTFHDAAVFFLYIFIPSLLITYTYISSCCRRSQSIMSFSSWLDIVASVIYFRHSSMASEHYHLLFDFRLLTRCQKELFKNFGNRKKAQT